MATYNRDAALEDAAGDLKDHIYDTFLGKATELAWKDMISYYKLSEQEVLDAQEKLGKVGMDNADSKTLLIEQMFVQSQVDYLRRIVTLVLKDM